MSETTITREEYNAKKSEMNRIEDQQRSCKAKIDSLEDQISALDRAISKMEALDNDFFKEQTRLTDSIHHTGEFKGDNFDKLISGAGENVIEQMKNGKRMINKAADDLIDLREKLEKEQNKQWGIFSRLADAYSSVKGWFQKHANDFFDWL